MAAGLGFKDFTTGEVLTAADVDGYLMQGVWVFASAAARDAAVTSPQEGNFAYLKDTNVTTYYTGSAWANLDTTGMTNPMTTTGDTIYSSSGSTPARLGIGSTGQVLTVAGGVPSWAAPAGGGKVLQVVQGTTTTETSVASTTFADTTLSASITPSAITSKVLVMVTQNFQSAADASATGGAVRLVRGATAIYNLDANGYNAYYASSGTLSSPLSTNFIETISFMYLDSPSTTSSTTYKTQTRTYSTANSRYSKANGESVQANIVLMEIGA